MRKARVWRAFLIQRRKFSETRNAWLAREDSNLDMANWNRMLSRVREEPQILFSLKFIGPSKRRNFENRTESAESRASEIKWAFRRIMSALCREGVRSSNEKSLPLLGLIAHKVTRRICG